MDYKELIKEHKYKEAAEELKKQLEALPSDYTRRYLAWCLYLSEQTADALTIAEEIEAPLPDDLVLIARLQWNLCHWDEMSAVLKRAVRQKPSAEIYDLLAIAEARGQEFYEVDDATNQIVRAYLIRATDFDDCPPEIYLRLAKTFPKVQQTEAATFLKKANERFPRDPEIILELTRLWIHLQQQYSDAIELLQPLLSDVKYCKQARWNIFEACLKQKNFDEASSCLAELSDQEHDKRRVWVDFLLKRGSFDEWLIKSEDVIYDSESEAIVRGCFRKAYVNLRNGKNDQAIENFLHGAKKLLDENDEYINLHPVIQFYGRNVETDFPVFYGEYEEFDVVTDVCESLLLLAHEGWQISNEVMGLLAIVINSRYEHDNIRREELAAFFPQKPESLLLFADEKLGNPANLASSLAFHFLSTDVVLAANHYLRHAIWSESDNKYLEDTIKGEIFSSTANSSVDQDRLAKLSEVALANLRICKDDRAAYAAFDSFYSNIWRKILLDTQQYATVVEINKRFVDATDGEDGLFDYAYGLDAVGMTDEAEEAYRRLLTKQPKNASAINNLGVIYSRTGRLDEALACYIQAVELAPTEQLYEKNRDTISAKIKFKDLCAQKAKDSVDAIKQKAFAAGITDELFAEINALYWANELSAKEIQERFGLGSSLNSIIIPIATNHSCPNCGVNLVFKNRTDKSTERFICLGCGHENRGMCRCDFCQRQRQEQVRQATEARQRQALEEFQKLEQKYCKPDYVIWAISGLVQKEADFLRCVILHSRSDKSFGWQDICAEIGVGSERPFIKKLSSLKLLLEDPNGELVPNSDTVMKVKPE